MCTRLPITTTQNVTHRGHHARRRTAALTSLLSAIPSMKSSPINDDVDPSDLDKIFGFSGLVEDDSGRCIHRNADRSTMIADSGASGHLLDHQLIPRLQDTMRDFEELKKPKTIVVAGKENVYSRLQLGLHGDTSSTRLDSVFRFESPP